MSHTITAVTDFAQINEGAGKKLYTYQIGATGVWLPAMSLSDESGNSIDAITGTPAGTERGIVARIAPVAQKTMANSIPVVLASDQSAIPVSGTFWQATQPISATQLPSSLGQKTMAASMSVALASDQSALPVSQSGGTPWLQNLTQLGGTVITAVTVPTGGDGQPAFPVQINAVQKLTYDVGIRNTATGALTANTAKAVLSFEHGATSTKTVRIRRIAVHAIQTTALSGLFDIQITSGTAASSAGTAQTVVARKGGDAPPEVVVKSLPTIVAATIHDNIPGGGFASTTALYSPPVLVYDWQEGGEMKPYMLRAGVLESIVLSVISTAAHNLTLTISVDLTEE